MISYSINQNRNTYYVYYRMPDKTGKIKQYSKSTGIKAVKGNKHKAEEFAREYIASLEERTVDYDKMIVCDYIENWIERNKYNISISTYDHYVHTLVKHIKPYFSATRLCLKDVKPLHIEQYMNEKLAGGLSPNTVNKHYAIIRTALQDAVKNGYLRTNPAEFAKKPKRIKPTHEIYGRDELRQAFQIVKGTDIELPVFFAMFFGLRRSEALGLRWSDIDFDAKVMTIRHTAIVSNSNGKTTTVLRDETKTEASNTQIPLNDTVCNYLSEFKAKQSVMPRRTNEYTDFVCVDSIGELIKPDFLTHKFPKLMEQNGLKHICFHELRHSCISLVAGSYTMKVTQAVARHANFNMTADTYSHIDNSQVAVALDSVTDSIGTDLLD